LNLSGFNQEQMKNAFKFFDLVGVRAWNQLFIKVFVYKLSNHINDALLNIQTDLKIKSVASK